MLEPGAGLPALAVPDDTGAVVDLGAWTGKPLVVWFYPKADTPG